VRLPGRSVPPIDQTPFVPERDVDQDCRHHDAVALDPFMVLCSKGGLRIDMAPAQRQVIVRPVQGSMRSAVMVDRAHSRFPPSSDNDTWLDQR
jgi:hypothetical protein